MQKKLYVFRNPPLVGPKDATPEPTIQHVYLNNTWKKSLAMHPDRLAVV